MVPAAGEPEQRDEGTHHEPGDTRQRRGRAPVCQVGDLIYGFSTFIIQVLMLQPSILSQQLLINNWF